MANPARSDDSNSSRARLIAAGRAALVDANEALLVSGLTIDQVTKRARVSPQTFHNIYPGRSSAQVLGGKEAFIAELLGSLHVNSIANWRPGLEEVIADRMAAANGDPREAIRGICRWNFEHTLRDPGTQLRFVACATARDNPRAAASINAGYNERKELTSEAVTHLLRSWGANLRQPFTVDLLSLALRALLEGLVLRARFDPAAVPPTLYGDIVLGMIGSVVDVEGRHEHVDDAMEPVATAAMRHFVDEQPIPDDPEQVIIDAARLEFAGRGYFRTERSHIAVRAGIDPDTLRRLFPTNVDIVVAALTPAFESLRKRVSTGVRLQQPATQILNQYGRRLAELIISERPFFDAMALLIALHTAQGQVDTTRIRDELNFSSLISEVIAAEQKRGKIIDTVPAGEIAATYTNNVLFRGMARRTESADEIVATVDRIVLHGALVTDPAVVS
ncbi:TetR/AcrR family transcriptional regulator [Skermania piniformis]|uniref:TetR/AcrR family transcriptional regulator helix-turn-helix transcriptional regulator n=1 Tax=Skermania pinensis TaxID=39122 RepID=A0ABX8S3U5_9ACTN|nr:TetR/AcrR family transcriptional regulator [Skermania piniformis]QXQ12490.1 TetR/AcrR family transcriptional regulator; helix-turn-helix transcriptional regulator [Skermania piniformis]